MNIFNKLKIGAVGLFCFFMTSLVFAASDPFCCHYRSVKDMLSENNIHLYFGVISVLWVLFKLFTKCTLQEKYLTALCVTLIWILWFI
ncbi:hypothetical protein CBG25_05710 [Arsenophonus sp. ENCA]|nr:hypothetical protein CBG25_05710 [Arsenophonus sp. ENCA]